MRFIKKNLVESLSRVILVSFLILVPVLSFAQTPQDAPSSGNVSCFIPDASGSGGKTLMMTTYQCDYFHGTYPGGYSTPTTDTNVDTSNTGTCFIPDASGSGGKTVIMSKYACENEWHGTYNAANLGTNPANSNDVNVGQNPPTYPVGQNPPADAGKIVNPLGPGTNSIQDFIHTLLTGALRVGIPIVALAIIYCGFLFVSARGNAEKLSTAKSALMYTLIGAAILLGSWAIATMIKVTVLAL